jgi:hypothetical protein
MKYSFYIQSTINQVTLELIKNQLSDSELGHHLEYIYIFIYIINFKWTKYKPYIRTIDYIYSWLVSNYSR